MTTTVTVETFDLRLALTAVVGHCSTMVDDTILRRIRLEFDGQHVTVSATNRYSAALAIASVWVEGELDPDHLACDLTPRDVAQILAVFRGGAISKDGEMGDTLRLDVDIEAITVTDTGGLFEGKSLSLPRLPMHEHFPSIGRLMRVAMDRLDAGGVAVPTIWADPRRLSLFRTAGSVYGAPLIVEATGKTTTLVIRCGESFLGLLMPQRPGEDEEKRAKGWRDGWLARLPKLDEDDERARQARSFLSEGNGVTVSWSTATQDDVGVSVGEGMDREMRARLAHAVEIVLTTQVCTAAMLKRKLRVKIGDARHVVEQLVEMGVCDPTEHDDVCTVLVAAEALDTCLAEHGLSDALTSV